MFVQQWFKIINMKLLLVICMLILLDCVAQEAANEEINPGLPNNIAQNEGTYLHLCIFIY